MAARWTTAETSLLLDWLEIAELIPARTLTCREWELIFSRPYFSVRSKINYEKKQRKKSNQNGIEIS